MPDPIEVYVLFPDVGPHCRALMPLSRVAWLVTVAACLLTALVLLLEGYDGYALVAVAVGLSAAINLV